MSNSGGGYNPAPPKSPRLTIEQMQQMIVFFKGLFEDSSLGMYIKWAGWGALITVVLEIGRMIWLAYRYHRGV